MLLPIYTSEQLKELYMSKKVNYIRKYEHSPIVSVVLTINDKEQILLWGLIDTGSTLTILSNKISSKYFKETDMDFPKSHSLQTANGLIDIFPIKGNKNIRINAELGDGFNMEIYTGVDIDKKIPHGGIQANIDIILGLSFLGKCTSFWLDAKEHTFILEFWS